MTREDCDEGPDRFINTLVWHQHPTGRTETGSKGEMALYGYERKDNGKIMWTPVRGCIDDNLGAPERQPGEESEPLWLLPRLGAPDRVGKVSTSTNRYFDDLVPRCNCTKTQQRDLLCGAGESDYRRNCRVHGAALVDKKTAGDKPGDGCNCNVTRQWDLRCGRMGWDHRRRCIIHGNCHSCVNADDEDDTPLKRILSKCLSVLNKDDGTTDQPPTRAESFLGLGPPARPKPSFGYEKQGLQAMSEPKAARPRSFAMYSPTLHLKEMQHNRSLQESGQLPPYNEAPPVPPTLPMSPGIDVSRSKSLAVRLSHHTGAYLPSSPTEKDDNAMTGIMRSKLAAARPLRDKDKDAPLPPLPTTWDELPLQEQRGGPAATPPPSYAEVPLQSHRADTARPPLQLRVKEAPLPPVPTEHIGPAGASESKSAATKANHNTSAKRRPRTSTASTASTVNSMSSMNSINSINSINSMNSISSINSMEPMIPISDMSPVSGFAMDKKDERDQRYISYEAKGRVQA